MNRLKWFIKNKFFFECRFGLFRYECGLFGGVKFFYENDSLNKLYGKDGLQVFENLLHQNTIYF